MDGSRGISWIMDEYCPQNPPEPIDSDIVAKDKTFSGALNDTLIDPIHIQCSCIAL